MLADYPSRARMLIVESVHTLKLAQIYPKLIPFFENLFSPPFNECVESGRELRHAISQVFESEVDIREGVGH